MEELSRLLYGRLLGGRKEELQQEIDEMKARPLLTIEAVLPLINKVRDLVS
jgi:hypothetical protein